ncbi:MAG: hypothetical protein IT537_08310 [Hyphomicrobiales bacterium]|nr:hypothetical protein [Hyphomicrobiales bacterium]
MSSPILHLRTMTGRATDVCAAVMIRFCLDRARECRRRAETTADLAQRRSWLAMEGRWFFLARSWDNQRRTEPADHIAERAPRRTRKHVAVIPLPWRKSAGG